MQHLKRSVCLIALSSLLPLAVADAEPLFRPGDRVVMLGDSITEGKTYTSEAINYITMRNPGMDITFVRNAGLRGDTAAGSMNRLQKDVIDYKPTVVTICFGMNDGRVSPVESVARDYLLTGLTNLMTTLKGAGIRVVLLTPGTIDPDHASFWFPSAEEMRAYNGKLGRLAEAVKELGVREQVPVIDIHTPMMEVTTRVKADNPKFAFIPDGVHPTEMAGVVMGYAMVSGLGYTGAVSRLQLDAKGQVVAAENCQARPLQVTADSISFVRKDEALPPYVQPAAWGLTNYFPAFRSLHEYRLTLTGLPAGSTWKLQVQGVKAPKLGLTTEVVEPATETNLTNCVVGAYTAEQLAAGVDLSFAPGPWLAFGESVWKRCVHQEQQVSYGRDFFGARTEGWMPPEAQKELAAMLKRADQAIADRALNIKRTTPVGLQTTWTLTRIAD